MKLFLMLLAFCLSGVAFAAETPMSGAEFEAYATGRTLTYAERGVIYGIEEYLPGPPGPLGLHRG